MPDSTPTAFYASRPTFKVGGERQAALGETLLMSLLVEETSAGMRRCEAHFTNWGSKGAGVGFLLFDRQTLDFGKELSIEMGPPGSATEVFAGRITALEAHFPPQRPPELIVLAEDRLQDFRMERRTRSFEQATDAEVFRQIASQHGLGADVDVDGPTYAVLTQINQSDLAFLRERAAAADAELWVEGRTLRAQARGRRDGGAVELTYGQSLIEFSVVADLADQRTSVRVSGWDASGKESIEEEAEESAVSAELDGRRGGGSVLREALGERKERVVSDVPLSQDEARALAEARYRERARRFVRGRGTSDGKPSLRVGTRLDLKGVGPLFEGKYYVTLARHTFDLRHGYRTAFECERPGVGR
ncbi:MAG TPA: contractile injection system protein, VgrG/Pvc8 family [Pyrinomonadaceae bacterium]|nr:contractile injection system protein, VgrG/Pvc8 family [Pyrinomonadaceae bacterium]